MIEEKINSNYNIPLSFDYKFKKVFGSYEGIERLEALISLYFNIPYEEVKGKINILNNEKKVDYNKQKRGLMDVYLRLELQTGAVRVNIEVSDVKLSKSIIDRNVIYGIHNISTQLKRNEDYKLLETTIVICFDKGMEGINEKRIIETYELRNEDGQKLTDKLQIQHVNIEKCYKIWYSNDIDKYDEKDQKIIKIGALLRITNKEEFSKCLGGIPMSDKIKEEIEKTNEALNSDDDILEWYDYERDRKAIENGRVADAKEAAIKSGMEQGIKQGLEQGIKEGLEQGIEQGIEQEKISNATKMKENNIDMNLISQITGLSIKEIEKL